MSIADDAQVSIFLADYAAVDPAGKINILGAGWSVTGIQPNGLTPEVAVVVSIDIPAQYRGQQFATCIKLLDDTGDAVEFPGPAGPQPLRVQQLVMVDPPMAPGIALPESMSSRRQINLRLGNGLPLSPNRVYRWVFEIDGNERASVAFYVAGPPPGPVIG